MKLGKLLTVTALATGVTLGAFVDSAEAMRRPPSPGSGGSNLLVDGGNPDISFDFFIDDELGNLIPDSNSSMEFGIFEDVIQNFSYKIPETGEAYFRDEANTYFFNDSGNLTSTFVSNLIVGSERIGEAVEYTIEVTSSASDEFSLSYPFYFPLSEVTAARLTKEQAINDITSFATLVNARIDATGSDSLNGSLFCNFPDGDNGKCKQFSDLFVKEANKNFVLPNGSLNPIFGKELDLSIGFDPENLELGRIQIELETVPEPTGAISLLCLSIFSFTTSRKQKK